MSDFTDLEQVKELAIAYASEQHCNFNVFLTIENKYAYATDSYMKQHLPNVPVLFKTEEVLKGGLINIRYADSFEQEGAYAEDDND